ncbi:hypothetical protein R0137_06975 [Congregibacter brevis]|uniref:Uncharacterized protein n=1 Tax=Congregibacter brevis TaxID=3081201 RepID=A0ABZ0IFR2_9GAMM|nr:hypothetical protein R0137_06975 [Congregibacter sp. IMCC45268]
MLHLIPKARERTKSAFYGDYLATLGREPGGIVDRKLARGLPDGTSTIATFGTTAIGRPPFTLGESSY